MINGASEYGISHIDLGIPIQEYKELTAGISECGFSQLDLGILIPEYKELTAGISEYGVSHLDSERTHLTTFLTSPN